MAAPYLTYDDLIERRPDLPGSQAELESLVAEFEEIAEDYRGVAFTPRVATEYVTWGRFGIAVLRPMLRTVTTLTVDGNVIDVGAVTVTDPTAGLACWSIASGPGTIVYEHGFPAPPARLVRAAAVYVEQTARSDASGTSRDVISQAFDGGTTRYSTPDKSAGRPTGWLEVDRLLNSLPDFRTPGVA